MCSFLRNPQTVWVSMFHGTNPLKHGNRSQQHSSLGGINHNRLPTWSTWSPACFHCLAEGCCPFAPSKPSIKGRSVLPLGWSPAVSPRCIMSLAGRCWKVSQAARSGHALSLFFRGQGPNRHKSSYNHIPAPQGKIYHDLSQFQAN